MLRFGHSSSEFPRCHPLRTLSEGGLAALATRCQLHTLQWGIHAVRTYRRRLPDGSEGFDDYSDSGDGEVHAVLPSGPRLVMRFTDRCTLWNRELGKAFADAFVQAYQIAR